MKPAWEYQVRQFGSAWRNAKPEEIEAHLNDAAGEGWELVEAASMSGGNRLMIILRRKTGLRSRKQHTTWPF
jgi:hypothetical protein